mgnify:CR=1 FL=1
MKPLSNSPLAPRVNSFSIPNCGVASDCAAVPSDDVIAYEAFAVPVIVSSPAFATPNENKTTDN